MAIKVKHEMNAAPAAAATLAAGRARRSMETARMFAAGTGSGGRGGGTTGAHASAISPGGAQAHVVGAHAPGVTDWEGTRRENAAQEAARQKQAIDVANVNNAAAKERAQMGIDADAERQIRQNRFTSERDSQLNQFQTERDKQLNQYTLDRDKALAEQRRKEREQALIDAGTHEYGYSPEVQREYDRLQREYDEGLQKGRYIAGSDDERRFMEDMERKIAALPKTLVQRKDPEGLFRNNTFTDAQGRIFTTDGKLVYNPADAETRRMEFQQRQMDATRSAADKLYTELKKPRKVTRMTEIAGGGEEAKDFYEERSDDEVMRVMQERYPQLFPAPPPEPTSPFQQALQNWWQGIRGGGAGAQPAQPEPTAQQAAAQPESQAQPVIRQDSQGVSWEVVFDENGKPIGKRRVRQ